MKNITILMLALVFISCGKKQDKGGGIISRPPTGAGYDAITTSELNSYLTTFVNRMTTAGVSDVYPGVSFSMTSSDICSNEAYRVTNKSDPDYGICKDGILGVCTKYSSGGNVVNRVITIDAPYWSKLTKADKEELMFHELAHCTRNRGHLATSTAGVPDSMMNPYHLGPTIYTGYYAKYLNELFDPAPGTTLAVFNGSNFNGGTYASTVASNNYSVEESQKNQDEIYSHQTHCIEEEIELE